MRPSLLSVALLVASLPVAAQAPASAPAGGPSTDRFPVLDARQVAVHELAPLRYSSLVKEDLDRRAQGLPPRFAVPNDCSIRPERDGTWESLDADTLLWRLRVRAPGALNLNLGFGTFHLPPSAALHLYSLDRAHVVRPFTAADNEAHGQLWTPVVATDELVVELVVALEEVEAVRLELTRIGQGYRPFGPRAGGPASLLGSGSCNYDVVCPEGDDWQLEIPSVGVISLGGSTFCTGFLVNNARNDLAPLFMTAEHCGVSATTAASLVVYWNYENSFCRTPGTPAAGGPGDGSLAQFNTGALFRALWDPSDFSLVELDDAPDPAFGVAFAGWDATGADASLAVAIHHPNTDEKRISYELQPTTTTAYLSNAVPGDGTHVRVEDWDLGTTEPGSSGSPLFNQDHRVIGQLHGGFASCSSPTSDWYGKLSASWTGGGTPASRLSDHLDPDGTGTLVTDTVSLATLCSDRGELAFDRALYRCEDALELSLGDCGLNADDAVAELVTVRVESTSEPGGEDVVLTETGPRTARFVGSLPVSATDAAGVLRVLDGDVVTARYTDADDGQGGVDVPVHLDAAVDCAPPLVTSVVLGDVDATTATLTITADEPIVAGADLGTACGAPLQVLTGTELGTTASVQLTGLTPDTTYFLHAVAIDAAGNVTLDDAGGACHSFTTLDVPVAFTEEFLGDADLHGLVVLFTPDAGPDGYRACARPLGGLATDPAGGVPLGLTDDGSQQVVLSPGRTVRLYGQTYSSFWVNSNGNLTFLAADGDFSESLDEHFGEPRVSVWWDDLNPSAGGSISWKELADRVVVTWEGVPEFSTQNVNTFQVELFQDGRLRTSYAALASTDGLVGLSAGGGVPVAFVETDLSGRLRCPGDGPAAGRGRAPRTGPTRPAR